MLDVLTRIVFSNTVIDEGISRLCLDLTNLLSDFRGHVFTKVVWVINSY